MRKNLSQLFYGVLHILLSGLIAAVFCNGVVTDLALLMGGRHVSGKVTAVTTALVATEGTPNYVIGFTYLIDGKLYEGESYSPSYSYVEGAAVEVEVVRLNSRLARLRGTSRSPVGLAGLFALAFPLFAIGHLYLTWPEAGPSLWRQERRRLRKGLASMVVVPIASAVDGAQAKVVGRVRSRGKLLCAPFTHEPCVAYSLVIEDNGELLFFDNRASPFVVEDASGLARVIDDDLGRSGVLVLSDDPARLVPVPFGDTGCWTKRPESWFVTCRLAVVRDGDVVAVAGRCARLGPDAAQAGHGYRQMEVSDQVSVSATATEPLLISKHDPATAGRS